MGGEEGDPQQGKGTGRGAEPGLPLQPRSASLWAPRRLALGRRFVKAKPGGVGGGAWRAKGAGHQDEQSWEWNTRTRTVARLLA